MIWCVKTYIIAYVRTPKKLDSLSIMSNLQPNCCLEVDFQKVDQHAGGKTKIVHGNGLVAMAETMYSAFILMLYLQVKSLQLIWKWGPVDSI